MSFFGKNIRKIRSIQKISQAEFADLFELSRASVGSYEEGRAEPKIELINKVANHFSITLDELINKELTVNELYHFDVGSEPTFKSTQHSTFTTLTIPLLLSIHELNTDTSKASKKKQSIQLPLNVSYDNPIAIVFYPYQFMAAPNNLRQNDILIIDTSQGQLNNKQHFLIKVNNAIYISKLNLLANNKILIKQSKQGITTVNIDEIDYYYPIIRFLGDLPEESESERINRLEEQLILLIEKTLQ